jgi:NitT/TauT family transport system permease protein
VIRRVTQIFGEAVAFLDRSRKLGWTDLALATGLGGTIYGLIRLAQEWTGALRPTVTIDLSIGALPGYALLSLSRGLAAYALSLLFTLAYGYWAARDRVAERVLIPTLDILQSIPVLGFMPGLVLGLVAAFPRSNVGLELASVIMIFTGQAWTMTFSFYHFAEVHPAGSHRGGDAEPLPLVAALPLGRAAVQHHRARVEQHDEHGGGVVLPHGERGVRPRRQGLPPPGTRLVHERRRRRGRRPRDARGGGCDGAHDRRARSAPLAADRGLGAEVPGRGERPDRAHGVLVPRFPEALPGSALGRAPDAPCRDRRRPGAAEDAPGADPGRPAARLRGRARLSLALFTLLLALLAWGAFGLLGLLRQVSFSAWGGVGLAATLTLGRVLLATAIGTLWTLPAGLAIGLSPRLSRVLQPVVQVVASFPAPMLFPAVVAMLTAAGVGLGFGSILLMLLGTQWYILFNVIAGATAIPADLREAARIYRVGTLQRFRELYLPAVFPYLVTGWVTAAGGAWNASIVSEYMSFRGKVLATTGLGARSARPRRR